MTVVNKQAWLERQEEYAAGYYHGLSGQPPRYPLVGNGMSARPYVRGYRTGQRDAQKKG